MKPITLLASVFLLSGLACSSSNEQPSRVQQTPEQPPPAVQVDSLPSLVERPPAPTRAGTLRMVGDDIENPRVAAIFLKRLATETDPAVRGALVDALPRTGGDFGSTLLPMLAKEVDVDVRVAMVSTLGRSDLASAKLGLTRAMADTEPAVREMAAVVAGMRADAAVVRGLLRKAIADSHPKVRAAAIRSLGVLRQSDDRAFVLPGIDDVDADVRLQSLRALGRIDPVFVRTSPEVSKLEKDADLRVSTMAKGFSQSN